MWWHTPRGRVADAVFQTVRRIETNQAEVFERIHKLEVLYDPNTPMADTGGDRQGGVHENAIAANVDTVAAIISTADVRARQMTDGADWHQQRTARRLEQYADEQKKLLKILPKCRDAFKEGAKKGNGLVKVTQRHGEPVVECALIENIVVPDDETRDNRSPRQLHEWVTVDADELIAEFPKFEKEILQARSNRQSWRIDGRYFPTTGNQVVYLDSYRLPTGIKGKKGYRPGRHTKVIVGHDLLDEKWEKPFFPYSVFVWTARAKSWYGISGAERIAGIQRALNKRNWHIEKQNDMISLPTTYVRPADANLAVKTSKIGQVAVVKGDYPHTVMPLAVSGETYQSRIDLRNSAGEEFGQSRMATHGAKPAGLDSGAALREFKDQTTERFAPQEKDFEEMVLNTIWLVLDVCKDLGDEAPTVMRRGRFGPRKIKWSDVDMKDVRIQLMAASTLPQTPAGRKQFVIELAQAGIISTDSSTRLMGMPDVEAELSLYTAAIESVEECLDQIADGKVVVPEPFMNLAMCRWRGQREYLKWQVDGAPEDKLEILRQFVVQAVWMEQGGAAAANGNAPAIPDASAGAQPMPGAMPGPQGPMSQGPMPMMPQGQPGVGTPVSALAPSAMHLMAGVG